MKTTQTEAAPAFDPAPGEGVRLLREARRLQGEIDAWQANLLMGQGTNLDVSPLERLKEEKRAVGRRLAALGLAAVA